LRTGVRLSSAVATAHAAGILHRDIKPANVLSNDYGWPALTDFGISSALEEELPLHTTTITAGLTDTGTQGGTGQSVGMSVPWSPPEMFGDDPQPDVRSDVFSLAATIYTILAGQTPFEVRGRSNGTLDLIGRIERGAITPMDRNDIPRSLLAVLNKGMASDRADRFATAVDFARALQRVELELGYAPTTIDVPNLLVAAPVRADEGDDNETRVRSVSTIEAQPVVVAPKIQNSMPAAEAEATMLRGAKKVVAQPQQHAASPLLKAELVDETVVRRREPIGMPPAAAIEAAKPQPLSRRGNLTGWVIGGVALVVVLGVAAGVMFGGATTTGGVDPTSTVTAPPVVIESIPTPQLAALPIADGSTVTFTFTNPDPKEGDVFFWQISNRTADEPVQKAEGNSVVIADYAPGSTVCVTVSISRAGKLSANPYESCYPA
ncbi:protein kinase domain-containing protein, partial [Salinibacterium sp.]|uniref:serine/threonine-protein kinase n=1 Tax=Salinibacterium sp. TaxID=1915057 RepID=UPI00286BC1B7